MAAHSRAEEMCFSLRGWGLLLSVACSALAGCLSPVETASGASPGVEIPLVEAPRPPDLPSASAAQAFAAGKIAGDGRGRLGQAITGTHVEAQAGKFPGQHVVETRAARDKQA